MRVRLSLSAFVHDNGKPREPFVESITTRLKIKKVAASEKAATFNLSTGGQRAGD
jgi:hypothetical protein